MLLLKFRGVCFTYYFLTVRERGLILDKVKKGDLGSVSCFFVSVLSRVVTEGKLYGGF